MGSSENAMMQEILEVQDPLEHRGQNRSDERGDGVM